MHQVEIEITTRERVEAAMSHLSTLKWERGVQGEGPVWRRCSWSKEKGKYMAWLYEQAAADVMGITYKPWYMAEPGEWGCSDDGVVQQCRTVYRSPEPTRCLTPRVYWRKQVAYPCGRPWVCVNKETGLVHGNYVFNVKEFIAKRAWAYHKPVSWMEGMLQRKTVRRNLALYVHIYYVRAGVFTDDDIDRLCEAFFPAKHETLYNKRYFLQWHISRFSFVKTLLDEMIRDAFNKQGFTLGHAISMMKDAYEKARDVDDPKTMLAIARDVIEVHKDAMEKEYAGDDGFDVGMELSGLLSGPQDAHVLPADQEERLLLAAGNESE